jgi:hypothetical protein
MHDHNKKQKPPISCAYAHSLCVVGVKKRKINLKNIKLKNKLTKTKKPKIDLILSHVSHIFYIWTLKLHPKPLDTLIV